VQLGFAMGYAPPGTNPLDLIALAQEAERLGYGSAWTAEAWGSDAVTVLSWLAATTTSIELGTAIMQIPARTPASTAMTAATLDLMSGGRFLLGLGTSGPQVVEGWHGQAWGKPLTRTREYVEIVRRTLRREALEFDGDQYQVPHSGEGATGLGRPLKLMMRPLRSEVPIYLAALSPRNVRLAFEIADGWLPVFFSPERARAAFEYEPRQGFEIAPTAHTVVTDDPESARDFVRPILALYVGGMGSREANFYNRLVRRYGYEAEAERIQQLYLEGKQLEAIAAVPDALIDEVALIGPPAWIRERLDALRESGVTRLLVATHDLGTLRAMAEIAG
jgi:F420-dependent oxidoreductase-like protein